MNPILQKRIEEVAKEYSDLNYVDECVEVPAFIEGADFALKNQWISVDEALPPIREKGTENRSWSDWVLIMTHKGGTFMDCYAFHRKEWLNNGNDVTHWMMIPTINKEEK